MSITQAASMFDLPDVVPSPSTFGFQVGAGQTTQFDFVLTLAGLAQSVTVSAGTVENAYRVDNVDAASLLGPLQG